MKLREVVAELGLEVAGAADALDREISGGYASDLLSCVMARARAGNVWVTLQSHPNIVAVASLLNLSGIIVTEGVSLDPATIEKADEENIPLLTTPLTTFTVVSKLAALGIQGVD
ncbi:MAG: DRTGG domain-containing protein [Anaerolineae bacterium]|jgi:predicted transcriptional regulator|nr:DRTGG domain-containing protein [Anaerolineae bacterium]MDH7474515.1 DRTGG domain-containing protein [Anaerolineae bacterium]